MSYNRSDCVADYGSPITINNLKLDIMAAIIAFLIFLSFCFGFFVAGLMAEEKRNEKTE